MAKFISYDGTDKNGIRAEVTVMTGSGKIKELIGRGKENEDGTYRNMEIVFDPDNPLLKRKVYGLLDTNAKELWEYIKQAHADQRTVNYRIESQRRSGVDRATPIGDLNATEQVRRILASVDAVYSHEAKTNPKEDPSNENPSALTQDAQFSPKANVGVAGGASADDLLKAIAQAQQNGFPQVTVETLMGHALAAGASIGQVQAVVGGGTVPAAGEAGDKYGSPAVARAAEAEQFALDHLIAIYTPPKSKPVDVTDEIIAQAAAVALHILQLADTVQVKVCGVGKADRMKSSYSRTLDLITDAIGKRYPVPVGGNEQEQKEWAETVVAEASERLYGLGEIAVGNLPKSLNDRESNVVVESTVAEEPVVHEDKVAEAMSMFEGAEVVEEISEVKFVPPTGFPQEGEDGFVVPDAELIGQLRTLCENAHVASETRLVSDWMERVLGVRSARKIHAPVLKAFCDHYQKAGMNQIRKEVLGDA